MRRTLLPLLAVLAFTTIVSEAQAVPLSFTHQGRLFDAAGDPIDGSRDIKFTLYDAPAGGNVLWSETQSVATDNGYYNAILGTLNPIDGDDIDGGDVYLAIKIGTGAELPTRIELTSVPFAIHAQSAENVSGGTVDASSVVVNGSTVINASGKIDYSSLINVPAGSSDTLADLSCSQSGSVARFDGSDWACGLEGDHGHHADDIVDGTLSVSRLPIGTTNGTVASGDHSHSSFSGTLSVETLAASGTVRIGDATTTCASTAAGTLRFNNTLKVLQACNGTEWLNAGPQPIAGAGNASSPYTFAGGGAARTCADYVEKSGAYATTDGVYNIDPDGAGGASPFAVYCDMTTDGGGWTLVAKLTGKDATMNRRNLAQWRLKNYIGDTTTLTGENALGKAYDSVPFSDVLIRSVDKPARNLGWHHPRQHPNMWAVVDAGVPVTDGVKLFGSVNNLDYAGDKDLRYHQDCTTLKYGFLMADYNYNDGQGIVGHTTRPHGHSGGVVGASVHDPKAAIPRTYGSHDGTYTYCLSDFNMGAGYANSVSGANGYNMQGHYWGNGNTYTSDFRPHALFVR